MFRLLLEEDKKKLKKEYQIRFFGILFIILSAVMILWIASMVPSLVQLVTEKNILKEKESLTEGSEVEQDTKILSEELTEVNYKISALEEKQHSTTSLIRSIVEKQIPSISLNSLTFGTDDVGSFVKVQGLANNRESVVDFSKLIEEIEDVSMVDLPFSNFTRDSDIPFNITVYLKEVE